VIQKEALSRPLRLLTYHPIIQVTSVISAFYYGVLYIVLATFSDLWLQRYNQSVEISGLHYIACALGEIAGSQLCASLMDKLFRRMQACAGGDHVPEFRIPMILPGAFLAPLGLLVYGWSARYRIHWVVVDLGIFITAFGMQITGMAIQAYVMDAYLAHTSSAMAASQFLRSLTAFLFPLFAPKMYANLGYGWGNSMIAFAGLVFGLPAPLLLWFWERSLGQRLRAVIEWKDWRPCWGSIDLYRLS
jgi:hypothetical protein